MSWLDARKPLLKKISRIVVYYVAARILIALVVSGIFHSVGMQDLIERLHLGAIGVSKTGTQLIPVAEAVLGPETFRQIFSMYHFGQFLAPGVIQTLLIQCAWTIGAILLVSYLCWSAYDKARTRKLLRQAAMVQLDRS